MISLVLITGFLGSGKTTLLRHINETNPDKKIVFLVNDFSAVDVDYQVLSESNDSVISVAGGSIFCKCLVTEFISQLKSIPERFPDTQVVVIEASGMANPSTFKTMLAETHLNEIYQADNIIAIVDPLTLPILYQTLPNIKTQIAMANEIILNKVDVADDTQVETSEKIINELNAFAPVTKTNYCEIEFNPIASAGLPLQGNNQLDFPSHFSRFSYKKNQPIKTKDIETLIHKFQQDLYRIKGYAILENQQIGYIDYDGSNLRISCVSTAKNISLEFIFNKKIDSEIVQYIKKL